jgi:hypothetical protein
MAYHGRQWLPLARDGPEGATVPVESMAYNGRQWLPLAHDGPEGATVPVESMAYDGPQWLPLAHDGPKGATVAPWLDRPGRATSRLRRSPAGRRNHHRV